MLTLRSPAKVNFFLRVTSRRADGYHELASLFQTINLFDLLSIQFAQRDTLSCNKEEIPTGPSNLIWKAIDIFRHHTGFQRPISIYLEKNIPVEAGLGGGSSNAATALWAMNELSDRLLSLKELIALSALVGSDVPFFFSTGTAYCTGRGEIMRPVSLPLEISFRLIKPPYGLSTPLVFRALDVKKLPQRDPEEDLLNFLKGDLHFYNDLEVPAYAISSQLNELRQSLLEGGFSDVVMTGSGSCLCCFGSGIIPSDLQLKTFHVKTINRIENTWNWTC